MRFIVTVEVEAIGFDEVEARKRIRKHLDKLGLIGYEITGSRPRKD